MSRRLKNKKTVTILRPIIINNMSTRKTTGICIYMIEKTNTRIITKPNNIITG